MGAFLNVVGRGQHNASVRDLRETRGGACGGLMRVLAGLRSGDWRAGAVG